MFTGIVDAQAGVEKILKKGRGLRLVLRVPAAYRRLKPGASVAVDGVCLTVVGRVEATRRVASTLTFDLVPETLKRTRFRKLKAGEKLNLERPLRWRGRVEGHLVQGHVDGIAKILRGVRRSFLVSPPRSARRFLVEKGSVALNGVSLTVGKVRRGAFWVHVIPHTLRKTNLAGWKKGSTANLEADLWMKRKLH